MIRQLVLISELSLQLVIAFDISGFAKSNDFQEFSKILEKGFEKLSGIQNPLGGGALSDSELSDKAGTQKENPATRRDGSNPPAGPLRTSNANTTCCLPQGCFTPCPSYGLPMAIPMYPPPEMPQIVPLRTEFEPVIHDHPPYHKIQEIIRNKHKKKKKKKKYNSSEMSSSSCESDSGSSDTELSDDSSSDTDIARLGNFMNFQM